MNLIITEEERHSVPEERCAALWRDKKMISKSEYAKIVNELSRFDQYVYDIYNAKKTVSNDELSTLCNPMWEIKKVLEANIKDEYHLTTQYLFDGARSVILDSGERIDISTPEFIYDEVSKLNGEKVINKVADKQMETTNEAQCEREKKFKSITDAMLNVYHRKNLDYGNSFGEAFKEFGLISAVVRMGDKYRRIKSLSSGRKNLVNESIKDTLMDMANYCIMTMIEMD